MRAFLIVSSFFLMHSTAQAQSMRVPPAAMARLAFAKLPENLQKHLLGIEKKAGTIDSFTCELLRESSNQARAGVKKYSGVYRVLKPNYCYFRIENASKKDDFIAYICNSQIIYEYSGLDKCVCRHKKPDSKLEVSHLSFLSPWNWAFINGEDRIQKFFEGRLGAAEFAMHFDITLLKVDANYAYLELKSKDRTPEWVHERMKEKTNRDKSESMIIVIYAEPLKALAYLPVKFRHVVGQDVDEWTFSNFLINPKNITEKDFQFLEPPEGWTKKGFEK